MPKTIFTLFPSPCFGGGAGVGVLITENNPEMIRFGVIYVWVLYSPLLDKASRKGGAHYGAGQASSVGVIC